jgi:hypothetical protein
MIGPGGGSTGKSAGIIAGAIGGAKPGKGNAAKAAAAVALVLRDIGRVGGLAKRKRRRAAAALAARPGADAPRVERRRGGTAGDREARGVTEPEDCDCDRVLAADVRRAPLRVLLRPREFDREGGVVATCDQTKKKQRLVKCLFHREQFPSVLNV